MIYKDKIKAGFDKALLKKLNKEQKGASKAESQQEASNVAFTNKRRDAENRASDRALAEELGVNIKELGE